jgi:hypothetical protein
MRVSFDHDGFQRGAVGVVAFAGAGAVAAAVAGVGPTLGMVVTLGAAALPLAFGVRRAARDGRLAGSFVAGVAALGCAWLVWSTAVGGGAAELPDPFSAAGLGLLTGLVASLGVAGACLRITRDPIAEAIDAARAELDPGSLALCRRAEAAAGKLRSAVASRTRRGSAGGRTVEVEAVARRVVLEIITLSRRQGSVAREAESPTSGELQARIADLDAQLARVTDPVARDGYARARAAIEDQQRRMSTLRATADRVMARLHIEVAALEGAALAIAARGGAATAEDAAALAPLADRLRDASSDLDLEAEANSDLAAL